MTADRRSVAARAALRAIRGYQYLTVHRTSTCRYAPSCSQYALDAISQYGVWRGGRLAARRLSRCHPFGGHGYDPVPDLNLSSRRAAKEYGRV